MNGLSLVLAAGAVLLAGLAAAADGALQGGDPEPEPAPPVVGQLRKRERAHRALALTRVLAHLVAGAAVVHWLTLQPRGGLVGTVLAIAAALVIVIIVEGIC
jgi:hypothetical protein